jgi:PA14 domain-containing protein
MKLCFATKIAALFAAGRADTSNGRGALARSNPWKYCLSRSSHAFALAFVIVLFGIFAHPAPAQNLIDPSESAGSVPSFAGTGLAGLFYDTADGYSQASGSAPGASFQTTNLCYPDCQGNSFTDSSGGLMSFTNGNASAFTFFAANEPMRATWDNSELDISGYIAIRMPGTYTFTIGSDDNTNFTIGGAPFQVLGGGPQTTSDTFTVAGLYPINVQFFEITGGSRLSLVGADPSGACIIGCYDPDGDILENDLFYSDAQLMGAPAPTIGGGWPGFAAAALIGAGALVRRRLSRA